MDVPESGWLYDREMRDKPHLYPIDDPKDRHEFTTNLHRQIQEHLTSVFRRENCPLKFVDEAREEIWCLMQKPQHEQEGVLIYRLPQPGQLLDFLTFRHTGWSKGKFFDVVATLELPSIDAIILNRLQSPEADLELMAVGGIVLQTPNSKYARQEAMNNSVMFPIDIVIKDD